MQQQNQSFFKLPTAEKLAIAHPGGSDPQRGFSCVGSENSSTLYRKGLLKTQVPEDLRDARVIAFYLDQGMHAGVPNTDRISGALRYGRSH